METGVLFFFYLISFVIGSLAMGFCMILYLENKSKVIEYFTMLLSIEFFNDIANLILLFYKVENKIYFSTVAAIASFLEFLILGFLISTVTKVKFGKIKLAIIAVILFAASASLVAERILIESSLYMVLKNINFLFYTVIIYYLFISVRAYFKEKNSDMKLILTIIIITFVVAIPLAILRESFFYNTQYLNHVEDSVIYLMLNIGGFILFFRKMSLKMEIKKETENNERVTLEKERDDIKTEEKNSNNNDYSGEKLSITNFALTQREIEITELIMDGLTNQDIADKLFISIKTVKTHIYNVYQKLDIKNRTELIFKFKK